MRVRLGDIASSVMYGYTASAVGAPTSTKLLRTTDIVALPIDWDSVPHCADPSSEDLEKYRLKVGDIVVSRMGTVGVSAFVSPPCDAVFASYLVRFQIDRTVADPRFVSFVLRSRQWWEYVHARKGGAVQPNLNAKVMKEFGFELPSLEEQRVALEKLAPIDDLIEVSMREAAVLKKLLDLVLEDVFQEARP